MQKKHTYHQFTRIMRFTAMQVLVAVLTISCLHANNTNAQEILNQRITINAKQMQLQTVLQQIETQASVTFTYSPQKIADNQAVSIKVKNEKLKTVMQRLLTPIAIEYQVFNDKTIVLTKVVETKETKSTVAPIKGSVKDGDGNPLIGATIQVKGGSSGTVTDIDGNFAIEAKEGDILIISYTGYTTQEIPVGTGSVDVVLLSGVALEGITVIGSRGKARTDLDSPVPIDAIQATELLKTGQPDIAQSIHFTCLLYTSPSPRDS